MSLWDSIGDDYETTFMLKELNDIKIDIDEYSIENKELLAQKFASSYLDFWKLARMENNIISQELFYYVDRCLFDKLDNYYDYMKIFYCFMNSFNLYYFKKVIISGSIAFNTILETVENDQGIIIGVILYENELLFGNKKKSPFSKNNNNFYQIDKRLFELMLDYSEEGNWWRQTCVV